MTECMICNTTEPRRTRATGEGAYVCPRCEKTHAHLLDDDDVDGRSDARHLTILAIDLDD